jgi:penicillin V acylase-like amidase (Ntn superfamily)
MLHILNNVSVPKGAVIADNKEHYTLYSSVIDADAQIYYYRTYDSFDTKIINASDFDKTNNRLAIVDIM